MADIVSLHLLSLLPAIYRINGITVAPQANGYEMTAQLHHASASLTVNWQARQPDVRLKPGVLVAPRWKSTLAALDQPVAIHRLVYLDRPERSENLFRTVPARDAFEAALFERAGALWERLPLGFRELFNTLFWDGQRFLRYCTGPSSMIGHHARACGNLLHSVEVAETVLRLLPLHKAANEAVALFAALVHDAGKADEYQPRRHGGWNLSDRGCLIGHRTTVVEWLAVARSRMRLGIPDTHYLSLLHALTAAQAPEWVGLRRPQTPEAHLLSLADRASGHADLVNRHQAEEGGWGRSHPHLNGRPWTLPETPARRTLPGLEAVYQAAKAAQGQERQ